MGFYNTSSGARPLVGSYRTGPSGDKKAQKKGLMRSKRPLLQRVCSASPEAYLFVGLLIAGLAILLCMALDELPK